MTDAQTIARLQKQIMDLMADRDKHKRAAAKWQSKATTQRNEIARMSQHIESLQAEKAALLADLKWIRGEAA
jgi:predicted  nucleic acid-binding Zn-ribbon protein